MMPRLYRPFEVASTARPDTAAAEFRNGLQAETCVEAKTTVASLRSKIQSTRCCFPVSIARAEPQRRHPRRCARRRTRRWDGFLEDFNRQLQSSVRPLSTGPTQAKWSSQASRRGWKSRVSRPMAGLRPAMFGPLRRLSFRQDSARSVVLLGDHVIDLERKYIEPLGQPTVLARVFGAVPDDPFQRVVHRVRRPKTRTRPTRSEPSSESS